MPTKETRAEKARRLGIRADRELLLGIPLRDHWNDGVPELNPVTIPEPTLAAPAGAPPRCGWCGEPAVRLGPVNAFWPPRERPLIVSWSCAGHLFWLSLAQEVN